MRTLCFHELAPHPPIPASLLRRVVFDDLILPTPEQLGCCPRCTSKGESNLLASEARGQIPVYTLSGLAHKTKPCVYCRVCKFEELLGPESAAKHLNCRTSSARQARVLFHNDLVRDLYGARSLGSWRPRSQVRVPHRAQASARPLPRRWPDQCARAPPVFALPHPSPSGIHPFPPPCSIQGWVAP